MDANYTAEYEQFELRHWWFVARREILHQQLDRFARLGSQSPRWLDVGCGTGVLLHSYPAIDASHKLGLELDAGSVSRAQAKGLQVRRVESKWDFAEYGRFDLITMTDVIEHVQDEREALDAVRAVLNDNGILLVTVPALMSLWSSHDVVNRHFRRYTRPTLLKLFPPAEWEVLKVSYFSSLLLPLVWTARKWKNFRTRGQDESHATHDFKFGKLDGLLKLIFRAERPWLRIAGFPLGSSILLVLRKRPLNTNDRRP
ncbi:MAG TPA: class I SAM-dependent methyltransferase [Tepidisphaeraceae bacterium]|jgi:SAM-dependent methyltransferase|nr:class I SAM-dependent methyltransferase [Tepidisphaeraceae bacterium]